MNRLIPLTPSTVPLTAAAHDEIGAIMQIGRRGSVDEVRELSAGNVVLVRNGAHYRAHRQAVEVVVNEDEHAQQECGECCSLAAFDVSRPPILRRRGFRQPCS